MKIISITAVACMLLQLLACNKEVEHPAPLINISVAQGKTDTTGYIASTILKQNIRYSVYLPPGYYGSTTKYPVLYLLHGMGGNHLDWVKGGMAKAMDMAIADRSIQPFIVIMPDGKSGFYCNNFQGMPFPYENFFMQEFIPYIESNYRVKTDGKCRAVAGLSMGGYGTALYAFGHPDKFCAGYAMSAAFDMGTAAPGIQSIITRKMEEKAQFPVFTMECGTDDFLFPSNQAFDLFLCQKNITHQYVVRAGAHDWNFWKVCMPKAFRLASNTFEY